MLDTGASGNLIKESVCRKLGLEVDREQSLRIEGIGGEVTQTLGKVECQFTFCKIPSEIITMQVIADDKMRFPIILGRKFCSQHKLIIDLSKRKITKVN